MAELKITDLDFQGIKDNIKVYLKQQDEFKDYNFEGSAMSVLIDTLAYNTYYNGYYSNVISNELFLDTAQLRKNVILKAKQLNYIAKSKTAAYATLRIVVNVEDSTSSLTLPEYSVFNTEVDGQEYNFLNLQPYTASKTADSRQFIFENVEVYQGELTEDLYYYQNGLDNKFIILNDDVDVSTLRVFVSEGSTVSQNDEYSKSTDYVSISAEDNVYWVSRDLDEKYYVYFGDGIIGSKLPNNYWITLRYLSTEGVAANNASVFSFGGTISDYDDFEISLQSEHSYAIGGTDQEDVESIRFNAPKFFQTQNRAVTVNDYMSIAQSNYSNIRSINAWGGEDNDPPQYGRVYLSIQPIDALYLSEANKLFLKNLFKKYSTVSTRVEIVDPKYTYISFDTKIKYDSRKTNKTTNEIKELATQKVISYVQNNVSKYDTYFRYSKFMSAMDTIDESITSNISKIKMMQYIYPDFTSSNDIKVYFNNALDNPHEGHRDAVVSSRFHFGSFRNCYIKSIYTKLIMVYIDSTGKELVVDEDVGNIDSKSGTLQFTNFYPTGSENADGSIELYAVPENYDIIPLRNQIIATLPSQINISVYDDNKIILQSEEGSIATY